MRGEIAMAPVSPDPKEALSLIEAAKGSWQWLLGGIFSGAYGAWKYIHLRFTKVEDRLTALVDKLVTQTDLIEHTREEEGKFNALFEYHNDTTEQLTEMTSMLRVIGEAVNDIKAAQSDQERRLRVIEEDLSAIKERHRIEEHDRGRRVYDQK